MYEDEFHNQPADVKLQIIAGSLCIREHTLKFLEEQSIFNIERTKTLIEIIYLKKLRYQIINASPQPDHSIPNVGIAIN